MGEEVVIYSVAVLFLRNDVVFQQALDGKTCMVQIKYPSLKASESSDSEEIVKDI